MCWLWKQASPLTRPPVFASLVALSLLCSGVHVAATTLQRDLHHHQRIITSKCCVMTQDVICRWHLKVYRGGNWAEIACIRFAASLFFKKLVRKLRMLCYRPLRHGRSLCKILVKSERQNVYNTTVTMQSLIKLGKKFCHFPG